MVAPIVESTSAGGGALWEVYPRSAGISHSPSSLLRALGPVLQRLKSQIIGLAEDVQGARFGMSRVGKSLPSLAVSQVATIKRQPAREQLSTIHLVQKVFAHHFALWGQIMALSLSQE